MYCSPGARLRANWALGSSDLLVCSSGIDATGQTLRLASRWLTISCWAFACKCTSDEQAGHSSGSSNSDRRAAAGCAPLFQRLHAQAQAGKASTAARLQYAQDIAEQLAPDPPREERPTDDKYTERAAWELLRICLLNAAEYETLTEELMEWLDRHGTLVEGGGAPLARQVAQLRRQPAPEGHTSYWEVLQRLVALGRTEEALDLLGAHSLWTASYSVQQADSGVMTQVLDAIWVHFLLSQFVLTLLYGHPPCADVAAGGSQPAAAENAALCGLRQGHVAGHCHPRPPGLCPSEV